MSVRAVEELQGLNGCLGAQRAGTLLDAACGVLLRSVRLSQVNRAISSVTALIRDICGPSSPQYLQGRVN